MLVKVVFFIFPLAHLFSTFSIGRRWSQCRFDNQQITNNDGQTIASAQAVRCSAATALGEAGKPAYAIRTAPEPAVIY